MPLPKGFILIITLSLIAMLSAFILALDERIRMYLRVFNQIELAHQHFDELEEAGLRLLKQLDEIPVHCFVTEQNSNEILHRFNELTPCRFTFHEKKYRYLISSFKSPFCLIPKGLNKAIVKPILLTITHELFPSFLQLKVGKIYQQEGLAETCRVFPTGLLSFRYFNILSSSPD